MGGLGEEKSEGRKIVNEIKRMREPKTGEGQGISASMRSLSLLDLSRSRVYSGSFYESFMDGFCLWGGLNSKG